MSFKNVNLCNTDKKALARVRLYFDKEAKDALTKNFNGSLPTEWVIDELFKGEADPNSYTATTYITSGYAIISGVPFFEAIAQEIGLSSGLVERAFMVVGLWESGGQWGMW